MRHPPNLGLGDTIAAPTCGWPNPAETREGAFRVLDAEGGYVLRHRLQQDYGAPSMSVNIDIFRIANGKISEHWDLRQDVPETARNSNGVW